VYSNVSTGVQIARVKHCGAVRNRPSSHCMGNIIIIIPDYGIVYTYYNNDECGMVVLSVSVTLHCYLYTIGEAVMMRMIALRVDLG